MKSKMNPAVKKIWIDALRSGLYKQGKHQLRISLDRFCTLGVLCNLHAQAHPEIAAKQTNLYEYLGEFGILPVEVMKWAGLTGQGPSVYTKIGSISYLNDSEEMTFDEIADVIEEYL